MNLELQALLANEADGKGQVSARKAIIAAVKGEEADAHKASLARESAALASISARIAELQSSEPKPAKL